MYPSCPQGRHTPTTNSPSPRPIGKIYPSSGPSVTQPYIWISNPQICWDSAQHPSSGLWGGYANFIGVWKSRCNIRKTATKRGFKVLQKIRLFSGYRNFQTEMSYGNIGAYWLLLSHVYLVEVIIIIIIHLICCILYVVHIPIVYLFHILYVPLSV